MKTFVSKKRNQPGRSSLWTAFVAMMTTVLFINLLLTALAATLTTGSIGSSNLPLEAWLSLPGQNMVDTAATSTRNDYSTHKWSSSFPMGNTEACARYLSGPDSHILQQVAATVVTQWWTDNVRKHANINVALAQHQPHRHSSSIWGYARTSAPTGDIADESSVPMNITVRVDGAESRLIVSEDSTIALPDESTTKEAQSKNGNSMLSNAEATELWLDMLDSCHGPIFVSHVAGNNNNAAATTTLASYVLSPMGWLQAQLKCRDETLRRHGADEFCLEGWNHYLNKYYPFPEPKPHFLLRQFNRWLGSWKEPFWRSWHRSMIPLWQPYSILHHHLFGGRPPVSSEPPKCRQGYRWLDGACTDLDFILTRERFIHDFVQTARCMLHLEFPLSLPSEAPPRPAISASDGRSLPSKSDLKNILLVTVAARAHNVTPACDLVASAVLRGWDVVVGIGSLPTQRFDIRWKFVYALRTVEIALARSGLDPKTTVIVFLDAYDTLVNVESAVVLEYFRQHTYDFVWSSEETCFPMASWPHSLGAPEYTCDVLFPKSSGRTIGRRRNKAQFVNAGGWIGRGSTAMEVLSELALLSAKGEGECHSKGTDQLLANGHLLRHRPSGRVDLDVNSDLFLSGSQTVYKNGYLDRLAHTSHGLPSLCFGALESSSSSNETKQLCPAFFHFNGCGACAERRLLRDLLLPARPTIHTDLVGAVSVVDLNNTIWSTLPDVSFCYSSHSSFDI